MQYFFKKFQLFLNFFKKLQEKKKFFFFFKTELIKFFNPNELTTFLEKINNQFKPLQKNWEPVFKRNSYISVWTNLKKKFFK